MADWLWVAPEAPSAREVMQLLEQQLAADPVAAAIPPEEAERFYCTAFALTALEPTIRAVVYKALGVAAMPHSESGMRRAILSMLRLWRMEKSRSYMDLLIHNVGHGKYQGAFGGTAFWTPERFAAAYGEGVPILWLVFVARALGVFDDLQTWLRQLGPHAEFRYWCWVSIVRLNIRRIVYPEVGAAGAAAAAAMSEAEPAPLAAALKAKNQEAGALRRNVRRLEHDRKELRAKNRKAELEAKALLSQARGEVAAARRNLAELAAEQARLVAARTQQYQQAERLLRVKLATVRDRFLATPLPGANLLQGRPVVVPLGTVDAAVYRRLVESLGGTCVAAASGAADGFLAVEEQLRTQVLQQVLIKCDGLCRRKEERHSMAMGGFEVYLQGQPVWREGGIVTCGTRADSLVAEYGALVSALAWLVAAEPPAGACLTIWSDCKALVQRVTSPRPPRKKPGLVQLDALARHMLRSLADRGCQIQVQWVPRDQVHAVDRYCDLLYRETTWYHIKTRVKRSVPLQQFLDGLRRPPAPGRRRRSGT